VPLAPSDLFQPVQTAITGCSISNFSTAIYFTGASNGRSPTPAHSHPGNDWTSEAVAFDEKQRSKTQFQFQILRVNGYGIYIFRQLHPHRIAAPQSLANTMACPLQWANTTQSPTLGHCDRTKFLCHPHSAASNTIQSPTTVATSASARHLPRLKLQQHQFPTRKSPQGQRKWRTRDAPGSRQHNRKPAP